MQRAGTRGMPKRLIDMPGVPLLDMPHAAYRGACRALNYAEWFSWLSLLRLISCVFRTRWVSATRHSPRLLQRAQEGQEPVIRAETARSDVRGCGPSKGCFLQGQVSMQVDLGRVDRLVPEPKRDDGVVHSGGDAVH